jgi:photosystem II stability/assembly factor-like uncharacterized protein
MRQFLRIIPAFLGLALLGQGCISFSGTGSIDGGVWRTTDRGEHWAQANAVLSVGGTKTMNNASVTSFAPDPGDASTFYVATAESGLLFTTDGGNSWTQPKDLANARISAVAVDNDDKCTVYAVSGAVAVKTTDCTRTWSKIYEETRGGVALSSVVIDHFNARNVYLATAKGDVIKSTDAGTSWATVTSKPWNSGIIKLVIDPNDSRIVYVGTKSEGVWKTVDGGASWVDLSKGLEQFDGARDFYHLAADMSKRDSYVLVSRYGLLRSDDAGMTWNKIPLVTGPGQARIYAFAMNPQNGKEMYYSTATVFYKSSDGGAKWATKRLPTARVGSAIMVNAKNGDIIYLGTLVVKK